MEPSTQLLWTIKLRQFPVCCQKFCLHCCNFEQKPMRSPAPYFHTFTPKSNFVSEILVRMCAASAPSNRKQVVAIGLYMVNAQSCLCENAIFQLVPPKLYVSPILTVTSGSLDIPKQFLAVKHTQSILSRSSSSFGLERQSPCSHLARSGPATDQTSVFSQVICNGSTSAQFQAVRAFLYSKYSG